MIGGNLDIFSLSSEDIRRMGLVKHRIDTGTAWLVRQPSRQIPLAKKLEADEQVKILRDAGII